MRNAGRKLFFFFTLVIFAGALFCFRNVPLVKATNWLTGWSYRQQYTISQTTGAGTGYLHK